MLPNRSRLPPHPFIPATDRSHVLAGLGPDESARQGLFANLQMGVDPMDAAGVPIPSSETGPSIFPKAQTYGLLRMERFGSLLNLPQKEDG